MSKIISGRTQSLQQSKWEIVNPYQGVDWPLVHRVKTALHNHTLNTNAPIGEHSDTVFDTPKERIPAYGKLGFGAVAITEHDYVSYPWSDYGLTKTDLISIPGNELSKNSHILSYFNTYFDRRGEGPGITNGMIANIVNVGQLGGFLYVAHPNRDGRTSQLEYLLELLAYPQVLGLEVLNTGQFTRNHSEDLWDTVLLECMPHRNVWGTASDDAHTNGPMQPNGCLLGAGWTVLLLDNLTQTAARDALINGKSYFSSYRVHKGKDDKKEQPAYATPGIKAIRVDTDRGLIMIEPEAQDDTARIEWISANGVLVGTGGVIDLNKTPAVSKYVRARIINQGGQTMTQPFGLYPKGTRNQNPPVITLQGQVRACAKLGETITIPTAAAVDQLGRPVFAYPTMWDPKGREILCLDNQFCLKEPGDYLLRYRAKDGSGNIGLQDYTIAACAEGG